MAILNNLTVFPLSGLPTGGVSPFAITGVEVDFAVGNIPFMSAVSSDRPYERGTAPYRKEQFDVSTDPGEQSIVTWWLRSQSSFHGGAGLDYEVPKPGLSLVGLSSAPGSEIRFASSAGVNVWNPGKVTLLKKMTKPHTGGSGLKLIEAVDTSGVDCYLQSDGASLYKVDATGTATALTWGGSGTILSLAFDGQSFYAADATGIYKGTVPHTGGTTGGALAWNTGSSPVTIAWVKQRLMAAVGPAIYELVGGTPPALPTTTYTHLVSGWKWTGFTEGPDAIYVAGYAGTESTILKLTLDTTGAVPTLTDATVAASLPRGEYATSILGYLGTFLVIGTNRGVRVSTIGDSGGISEGALSLPLSAPVYGLTGRDRYVWATATNAQDGKSGLFRLDLSNPDDSGFFPYASDLQTYATGTASAVCQLGTSGRLAVAVDGQGSFLESATALETSGTLTTERIRFNTLDEKLFKFLQVRVAEPVTGAVSLSQVSELGATRSLMTFDKNTAISEVAIAGELGSQEFMSFTFTLTADVGGNSGPELHGYQLKALPAAKRQRQYIVPFLCFDEELDRNGVKWGYDGFSYERIAALEALEESGDIVLFQDFARHETRLVVIDQIQETEMAPMSGASGHGGYLVVQLRAVT